MTTYPHVFRELRIGNVTVRNRLMQTAHAKLFAQGGLDTQRNVDYQAARARGGIGLIITGNRLVHPGATTTCARFADGFVAEAVEVDRRITDAVHEHGAAIFAQLNHFGIEASSDAADDLRVLWGPSAVKSVMQGETAKEMEHEDIAELIDFWARSAVFSRDGGFDGVEVHIAHGYLLNQFLSPMSNHRTDDYGGSLENRLRLAREVVAEVRRRVGDDFVVGVRLTLDDFVEGGVSLEDSIACAKLLEADGNVDFFDLSGGGYYSGLRHLIATADTEGGWLLGHVARLKEAVGSTPVFAVGGITEPADAEQVLADGHADMVALTRAQLADPELPNKMREGRERQIYRCIRANQMCIARAGTGHAVGCTVNPETGREGRWGSQALPAVDEARRWVVVGGGPAGMKAAETLAARGHEVTLLERSQRLGGQVNLTVATPGRERFGVLIEDLGFQLERLDVDVRLTTEASPESVGALAPDGVLVATGAVPQRTGYSSVAPLRAEIDGVRADHVVAGWDVLDATAQVGRRVVVLDDEGTRQPAGVAEVLLDRGHDVEVVSRWSSLWPFTAPTLDQPVLYRRFLEKGGRYRLNTWARRIEPVSVHFYSLYGGPDERRDDVDTVVLCTGQEADSALYFELKSRDLPVWRIGDCVAPRRLDHAIYEGYVAGREVFAAEDRYILEGELERWDDAPAAATSAAY